MSAGGRAERRGGGERPARRSGPTLARQDAAPPEGGRCGFLRAGREGRSGGRPARRRVNGDKSGFHGVEDLRKVGSMVWKNGENDFHGVEVFAERRLPLRGGEMDDFEMNGRFER